MSTRAHALATRLEQGAAALAAFAQTMTDEEWRTAKHHRDDRPFGVIVHHVASVYPLEVEVARMLAEGKPVTGVTWEGIAEMNAQHHREHGDATKQEALALLAKNSKAAADAIRGFTDAELDSAAPVSLYFDAPLTAQFFLEDHAVRHSFHHLARMREALAR